MRTARHDAMAYDVALAARMARLGSTNDTLRAIEQFGPMWACMTYGHPDEPRWFLRRFRLRPWRCDRCGTWWTTVRRDDGLGGWREWRRVTEMDR